MKFNQEHIAENLYKKLNEHFKDRKELINISIEGLGVHWHCMVAFQNRACKIHCFEDYNQGNLKGEYLISFKEFNENKAWGRTHKIEEVLTSSATWFSNKGVDFLYQQYEFVDWDKRRVNFIENEFLKYEPKLRNVTTKKDYWSDSCDYTMMYKDRSCRLSGYGKNEPVSFNFQWDKCRLFEVQQNDLALLAEVMRKWLIDEIQPSSLGSQFDWIKISDLARYYEKGEGIKGEFIESWNSIEKFYNNFDDHFKTKILVIDLIKELRQKGFDERLRAGQSLYHFILSRSRRHGLISGQIFLKLVFNTEKNEMFVRDSAGKQILSGEIKFSTKLEAVLNNISKEEIS